MLFQIIFLYIWIQSQILKCWPFNIQNWTDFIIYFNFVCYFDDAFYSSEVFQYIRFALMRCFSLSLANGDNLTHNHITHCILMTLSEDLQNDCHVQMVFLCARISPKILKFLEYISKKILCFFLGIFLDIPSNNNVHTDFVGFTFFLSIWFEINSKKYTWTNVKMIASTVADVRRY